MHSLEGKVALVTGAASKRGMGHAVALRLAKEGANVVVVDKYSAPRSIWPGDEEWGGLDAVVNEINSLGKEAMAILADVSIGQEVDAAVAKALKQFGKIDILVHCGATRGPMNVPITELDEEVWKYVMDVNLTGSFLISRAVARSMITSGGDKKIVLVASLAGTSGYPGSGAYSVSKWGVIGLVKTLALELAPYKINVNAISPGAFSTNLRDEAIIEEAKTQGISIPEAMERERQRPGPGSQIPLGRLGTPEDIADLVSFLVSEQSAYITGEAIGIDGGL